MRTHRLNSKIDKLIYSILFPILVICLMNFLFDANKKSLELLFFALISMSVIFLTLFTNKPQIFICNQSKINKFNVAFEIVFPSIISYFIIYIVNSELFFENISDFKAIKGYILEFWCSIYFIDGIQNFDSVSLYCNSNDLIPIPESFIYLQGAIIGFVCSFSSIFYVSLLSIEGKNLLAMKKNPKTIGIPRSIVKFILLSLFFPIVIILFSEIIFTENLDFSNQNIPERLFIIPMISIIIHLYLLSFIWIWVSLFSFLLLSIINHSRA